MEDYQYMKAETSEISDKPELPPYTVSFCYACGARIPDGDSYCGKCGQPRRSEQSVLRHTQLLKEMPYTEEGEAALNAIDASDPIMLLETEGARAAIEAMTPEWYAGKKSQIATDAARIALEIYQPYIAAFTDISKKTQDGQLIVQLGQTLNELEGWVGMIKTYNSFRKAAPSRHDNLANLWSGIGEWTK